MPERPLLYLALFFVIGLLIFIASNDMEIRDHIQIFQYKPNVDSLNGKHMS